MLCYTNNPTELLLKWENKKRKNYNQEKKGKRKKKRKKKRQNKIYGWQSSIDVLTRPTGTMWTCEVSPLVKVKI